jgi:hypothetical protein
MPNRHTGTAVAKFHDERDILRNHDGEAGGRVSAGSLGGGGWDLSSTGFDAV